MNCPETFPEITRITITAILAFLYSSVAGAEQYWSYEYNGVEVIAPHSELYSRNIAHHMYRLDQALTQVLGIKPTGSRLPTYVYAIPAKTLSTVLGKPTDADCLYTSSGLDTTILLDAASSAGGYFNANFGYTGAVLLNAYSLRYPNWFIKGISELFAATTMDSKVVTVGTFVPERVRALYSPTWIPLETLLKLRADDRQLQTAQTSFLYLAESWFLTHLIVIEGKYRSNFFNYFSLLDKGMDENKAFAASFDISMEQLDHEFHDAVRAGHISLLKVEAPDMPNVGQAVEISEAEVKGRLARVALALSSGADNSILLANDALKLDAGNMTALHALARAQIINADYAAAWKNAERGCPNEPPTESDLTRCGELFSALAWAASEHKTTLPSESPQVTERARQYFEKAIAMNRNDLFAWSGMANLLADEHDVEHAGLLLQSAEETSYRHPRNGVYAYAVMRLCESVRDYKAAFQFAVAWEKNALTGTARDAASVQVSQLRDYLQRVNLLSTAPAQ
jgi:hypothetical protein